MSSPSNTPLTYGPRCGWLQNENRWQTYLVHYRACTLFFSPVWLDSCQSCHLSLTHFKARPIPLRVPFSLVLMADRLWPHSLSAAACPHCVPLWRRSVWVEDRLALQSEWLTRMYGLGVYLLTDLTTIHLQSRTAVCILASAGVSESEAPTEGTCGTQTPV